MRLYIAGPMRGLPEKNIPAFNAAEVQLREAGFETVNPARHDATHDMPYEWYLRLALADLCAEGIDGVATLERWQSSKGAQLEVQIALALRMLVRPVETWLVRPPCEGCGTTIGEHSGPSDGPCGDAVRAANRV